MTTSQKPNSHKGCQRHRVVTVSIPQGRIEATKLRTVLLTLARNDILQRPRRARGARRYSFRLTDEEVQEVRRAAHHCGMNVSQYVRDVLWRGERKS